MKGFIFTNFLDFVEKSHGLEMVDNMILNTNLASGGVYAAFNNYDYNELVALLTYFSKKTKIKDVVLLEQFGRFVFPYLICKHAYVIQHYTKPLDFLAGIQNHIHIEVKKIYNDADLPTFEVENKTDNKLTLIYKSSKGLTYFAIGLIKESLNHFNVEGSVLIDDSYDENEGVKLNIQLLT